MNWLWLACRLAQDVWDDELWFALATTGVRVRATPARSPYCRTRLNHLAASRRALRCIRRGGGVESTRCA